MARATRALQSLGIKKSLRSGLAIRQRHLIEPSMARPLRLEIPGAIYHLTARANARQKIFFTDTDRRLFLDILAALRNREPTPQTDAAAKGMCDGKT